MEHHKIGIDEQVCFILLRNCYNQIRISHAPYEPGVSSQDTSFSSFPLGSNATPELQSVLKCKVLHALDCVIDAVLQILVANFGLRFSLNSILHCCLCHSYMIDRVLLNIKLVSISSSSFDPLHQMCSLLITSILKPLYGNRCKKWGTFNEILLIWQEESKVEAEDKMGIELVRALEGNTRLIQLSNQEKKLPWGARAISVYRVWSHNV